LRGKKSGRFHIRNFAGIFLQARNNAPCRLILEIPDVNRTAINRALLSVAGSHQELNILGLFHVVFKDICPYSKQRLEVDAGDCDHVEHEPGDPIRC